MKTILFVDDDLISVTIYRRILRANGFHVETAANGAEALACLSTIRPDAVVIDLMMPKVSGVEMTRAVRAQKEYSDLPIVVLTAAGVPALADAALAAGANRVFDKLNDKPIRVVGYLHDLLGTTADTNTTLISKSGNPDAFTDF